MHGAGFADLRHVFIILDREGPRVLSAQGGSASQGSGSRGQRKSGASMVRKKKLRSLGRIYKAEREGLAAA